jgi:hypothetical protein
MPNSPPVEGGERTMGEMTGIVANILKLFLGES